MDDGSFPHRQRTPTAQATFAALTLMERCGLAVGDAPVDDAIEHLGVRHMKKRALSYTSGGSGVLPCHAGVVVTSLIRMGALETDLVQDSIRWLVDHQRFDRHAHRSGGTATWPYKAPQNYGCWESVSCYHGVAGAFRAFAAIPPGHRSAAVQDRLGNAIDYLRPRRLYKKTEVDRPLFRHLTRSFLVGDYRSDLLDMLTGIADADSALGREDWVAEAISDMDELAPDGRVTLVQNYGRQLIDSIPFEPLGEPSRFLSYEWARTRRADIGRSGGTGDVTSLAPPPVRQLPIPAIVRGRPRDELRGRAEALTWGLGRARGRAAIR